jgi:hypothetical protein
LRLATTTNLTLNAPVKAGELVDSLRPQLAPVRDRLLEHVWDSLYQTLNPPSGRP